MYIKLRLGEKNKLRVYQKHLDYVTHQVCPRL